MLKGIDISETIDIALKSDPDQSNPTLFTIGNLGQDANLKLFDSAMSSEGKVDMTKVSKRDVVRAGLRGIKNFDGKDFSPIPDDVFSTLSAPVVLELFGRIMAFNFPSENETKN